MNDDSGVVPATEDVGENVSTESESVAEAVQSVPEQVGVPVESGLADAVKTEEGTIASEIVVEPQEIPAASEAPEITSPEIAVSVEESAPKESASVGRTEARADSAAAAIVVPSSKEGVEGRRTMRAANLERIIVLARKEGSIQARDVMLELRVSESTAIRYLNALVVAARLRRTGRGRAIRYAPL